jgi:hypothetical protein
VVRGLYGIASLFSKNMYPLVKTQGDFFLSKIILNLNYSNIMKITTLEKSTISNSETDNSQLQSTIEFLKTLEVGAIQNPLKPFLLEMDTELLIQVFEADKELANEIHTKLKVFFPVEQLRLSTLIIKAFISKPNVANAIQFKELLINI